MTGLQRETLFDPPEPVEASPRRGWTLARRAGLLAFDGGGGRARESNRTTIRGCLVYWQTRAWLEREGLIRLAAGGAGGSSGAGWYALTDDGQAALRQLVIDRGLCARLVSLYA